MHIQQPPATPRPVVMLANGHSAFDTRIFIKEARTLVAAEYAVSIILPHAKPEQRDGVTINPVRVTKGGFAKLVINPWNIFWKALRQPKRSIFCIHDSDILMAGVFLKLFGRTVVYDAHEDTPLQISYQHWLPKFAKKPYAVFYYWLEKLCGKWFDAIIVAEPVIAKYFPPHKTSLVRNFSLARPFRDYARALPYKQRRAALIYIGTLSAVRGLFQMLDAAKEAEKKVAFDFVLGGQFAPASLEKEVLTRYRIDFRQWVPFDLLVELMYDAKIGIIIPNPIERYKTNYPVKMFEFMAAGLPVIASREGESAAFVEEAKCGLLVDPMDIKAIADAIEWLFTHPDEAEAMGKRGQELVMQTYNWEHESQTLLAVYNRLSE